MQAKRPLIALFVLLSLLILAVLGYGAVRLLGDNYAPWAFSISWQQMDTALETQTIATTRVQLSVDPDRRRFQGTAILSVAHPGGKGNEVFLLLNPGLKIVALQCDGKPVRAERYHERIRVSLPLDTTVCELKIEYQGWPIAANSSTLILESDEVLLDRLQFWYPVDLKSFSTLNVSVTVPEHLEVVWGGSLKGEQVTQGERRTQWEETRPVLAVGLALGSYKRHSRVQGSIRCTVFGQSLDRKEAEAYLSTLGDAYNYLSARLGPDNFEQLNIVLSNRVRTTTHAGGSLLLSAPADVSESDALFADLAGFVARNWWGDTVSGRWFSTRPEAGEWLLSGLAEYSAWQALRSVKGRRAYLRYIETRSCPPKITVPMKTFNLGQRLRPAPGYDPSLLRVRGAYAAAVIAAYAGPNAFDRACKNFMSVHRYRTVSFGALLHEITLASEIPLDELVRVWFDRPGTFDYRVSSVLSEDGRVYVTIENVGDIPAYVPMKLGIVAEGGYYVQDITPGANRETYSFPLESKLLRVILDPEFDFGDMQRANNMWPTTEWPTKLSVSANGQIALLSQSEWRMEAKSQIAMFARMDKSPEYVFHTGKHPPRWMQWDPSGRKLALTGKEPGVWSPEGWAPSEEDNRTPLGWFQGKFMTWDNATLSTIDETYFENIEVSNDRVCAAIDPLTGDVAFSTPSGRLVLREVESQRTTLIDDNVFPAGAIAWRAGHRALIYFERTGDLVSVPVVGELRTVLLHRNYPVRRSRISPDGQYVAWVDPAGLLRAIQPDKGDPVYISLPGEIVDFSWEGEEALVALVATISRRLPMRYPANYSLWRIPVTTWQGVQLPYDPVEFARTPAHQRMKYSEGQGP